MFLEQIHTQKGLPGENQILSLGVFERLSGNCTDIEDCAGHTDTLSRR
jgi:hypothetical protein